MINFTQPVDSKDALSLIRNPILRLDCFSLYCTCLSTFEKFPDNPYLVFAACEQLLAAGFHDYAFNIFCDRYSLLHSAFDHRRLRRIINLFHLSIRPLDYFFSELLALNDANPESLLTQKISQILFNCKNYSQVIHHLLTIDEFESLSYHSVIILAQSALSSSPFNQCRVLLYLDQIYSFKGRLDVLSNIMLICYATNEIDLALFYWHNISPDFIENWQMMLWFNRFILPKHIEFSALCSIREIVDRLKPIPNVNLCLQYLISLLRHSEISLCRQLLANIPSDYLLNPLIKSLSAVVSQDTFSSVDSVWLDRSKPVQICFKDCHYPVLVFFSGLTGAFGFYPFQLICSLFSKLPVNIVVLQDPSQKYFSSGLVGFGSTLQQSAHALINYLKLRFKSSIIYVGESVSGLAALNFALASPPSAVISFAGVLPVNDYSASGHKFSSDKSSDFFVSPGSYGDYNEPLAHGHYAIVRAESVRKLFPPLRSSVSQSSGSFQFHYVYSSGNLSDQLTFRELATMFPIVEHRITNSSTHFVANLSIAYKFYLDIFSKILLSLSSSLPIQDHFYSYDGCELQDLL